MNRRVYSVLRKEAGVLEDIKHTVKGFHPMYLFPGIKPQVPDTVRSYYNRYMDYTDKTRKTIDGLRDRLAADAAHTNLMIDELKSDAAGAVDYAKLDKLRQDSAKRISAALKTADRNKSRLGESLATQLSWNLYGDPYMQRLIKNKTK